MKIYLKKNAMLIFRLIIYTFLSVVFISIIPITTKILIEKYDNLDINKILVLVLIYIVAIIGFLLFEYLKKVLYSKFQRKINLDVKNDVFERILTEEHSKLNEKDSGYFVNLFTHDIDVIFGKYYSTVIDIYISVISFSIYFVVMMMVDWILGLIIVFSCFLSLLLPKIFGNTIGTKEKKASEQEERLISKIEELHSGKTLFNETTKNSFLNEFNKASLDLEDAVYNLNKTVSQSHIVSGFSLYFINIVAFIAGIILIYLKMTTIANFVAIIAFIDSIAIPTRDIIYEIITIRSTKEIKHKFEEIIYREKKNKSKLEESFKILTVSNLNFSYDEKVIFENFNLEIKKGKKIAIIGENGSGKSTLIKLLSGEIKGYDGKILVNNSDINNIYLYDFMFYSSIDNPIFNGSLVDNVSLYNSYPFILTDEIERFGLEYLYDKNTNSNLLNLSSGEISKIQILRAINSGKEFIIFDEIFANVDEESEKELISFLLGLDKTIVLITHNLNENLLKLFDEVINLSNK